MGAGGTDESAGGATGPSRARLLRETLVGIAASESFWTQDLAVVLKRLTESASRLLEVSQVGVWRFSGDRAVLQCIEQYDARAGTHASGIELPVKNYPRYFQALAEGDVVAASDARSDPRTSEFKEGYLVPLGIASMMDAPIHFDGALQGVVCHEHKGGAREWTVEEQLFAVGIGNLVAMALGMDQRKRSRRREDLLQEQLRQSQKMEAIGHLAGGVAHDFNNLLTVMHGHSENLQRSLAGDERARKDVDAVLKACDRAAALTRQLLAFGRRQTLRPRRVNINDLLSNQMGMLRRLIGEHIDLETRFAPDAAAVRVDTGQIEQVVMNLIVNARDAMPRGGRVLLETRNVDLDADYTRLHPVVRPGAYVMFAVSDTGVGMDAKAMEHLFEPFYTTKEQGSGLGLATAFGIVKQSDGYIWAYSEPGRGTTFKVYLPRTEEATTEVGRRPSRAADNGGSETILLAEDESSIRMLLEDCLTRLGYRVLTAADGAAAVALAEGHGGPIDALVTDVVMPKLDGRKAAERIAACRPGIKVLYMSGYPAGAVESFQMLDPGAPFLAKPFAPSAFAKRIRELLDATDAPNSAG